MIETMFGKVSSGEKLNGRGVPNDRKFHMQNSIHINNISDEAAS